MADRVRRTLTLNDLRFIGDLLPGKPRVSGMSPLHGGMINEVVEIHLGDEPFRAVVKLSAKEGDPFGSEAGQLCYLKESQLLPCPTFYLKGAKGEHAPFAFLAMERLEGMNLGQAQLDQTQLESVEAQLADVLGRLHDQKAQQFGFWGGNGHQAWFEVFEPMIQTNRSECNSKLDPAVLNQIDRLLQCMSDAFALGDRPEPRLIHGDVWSANIIVKQRGRDWSISGLVDPGLIYADVEYELAYLQCFGSIGPAFFDRYLRKRPMREGYEIRKRYYWLNTMLLHVHLFGDEGYVRHTRRIADELDHLWQTGNIG